MMRVSGWLRREMGVKDTEPEKVKSDGDIGRLVQLF